MNAGPIDGGIKHVGDQHGQQRFQRKLDVNRVGQGIRGKEGHFLRRRGLQGVGVVAAVGVDLQEAGHFIERRRHLRIVAAGDRDGKSQRAVVADRGLQRAAGGVYLLRQLTRGRAESWRQLVGQNIELQHQGDQRQITGLVGAAAIAAHHRKAQQLVQLGGVLRDGAQIARLAAAGQHSAGFVQHRVHPAL